MRFFSHKGVLGINARNLLYIRPYNPKKAIKFADDKIKTKQFLSARNIPVPKLYGIIKNNAELEKFDFHSLSGCFVIKPNNGYGGEGIIPIREYKDEHWISTSGRKYRKEELKDHIQDILDGRYSISSLSDTAFFEQLIVSDDRLGQYSYEGLPDIRVVVHNLIPVMAMLRLPTKESEGKANLHLGAVGVGIDIAKGETTFATHKNRIIEEIPNGKGKIRGLKIPHWDEILLIASQVQLITNLGYMAVDICIDRNSGPVLLEINARAGLAVQIANLAPLRKRLKQVEGIKVTSPTKGVRVAKDLFGNVVEKEIRQLSGKQIIGMEEHVEIIQKSGTLKIRAKIDTGRSRSVLDTGTAMRAGLLENKEEYNEEKGTLKLKFTLRGHRLQTIVQIAPIGHETCKMIVGSRDTKNFLIDTALTKDAVMPKKEEAPPPLPLPPLPKGPNYFEIDQALRRIDGQIKLLYHLRPLNIEEEKEKFFRHNESINPVFEYPPLKFDPLELIDQLHRIECGDSPLDQLFAAKKEELAKKIALIESIDENNFTYNSIQLYGKPEEEEVAWCRSILEKNTENIRNAGKNKLLYTTEDAIYHFEEALKSYGLSSWKVKIKENMVAACLAGKHNRLFIRANTKFSSERIKSLIIHEIETHILTAENGKTQPYDIFNRGFADYLITQEGMAMYNVTTQQGVSFGNKTQALAHLISIDKGLKGSFAEVYHALRKFGLLKRSAFGSALKTKRGIGDTSQPGAFTKDYIYYRGYLEIKEYFEKGGSLEDLYIGKIHHRHIELVKTIPGVRKPVLLPHWLNTETSHRQS